MNPCMFLLWTHAFSVDIFIIINYSYADVDSKDPALPWLRKILISVVEFRMPTRVPGLYKINSIANYLTKKINNQSLIP